jgi:hypothetical protein
MAQRVIQDHLKIDRTELLFQSPEERLKAASRSPSPSSAPTARSVFQCSTTAKI